MMQDALNTFAEGQAVTAAAIGAKVIDLGKSGLGIGAGEPIYLVALVDEDFDGADSLTITLESSDAANLTGSTVHFSSGAIPGAALLGGRQLVAVALPGGDYKRYLGVRFTPAGTVTGGKVTAFLAKDVQSWKAYESVTGF